MKFQFTTEGSKSQTKYHFIEIVSADPKDGEHNDGVLFKACVSTPLDSAELYDALEKRLHSNKYGSAELMSINIVATHDVKPSNWVYDVSVIGLDSICRIISNIKPLKQKVVITICGEKKTYELDADKLETLLKSLE